MIASLLPYLLVGVGGACGAMSRFALAGWLNEATTYRFPVGTFAVNILGCFLLGIVGTIIADRLHDWHNYTNYGLAIGFLGAFTTFSTFAFEKNQLIQGGEWLLAAVYAGLSITIGILMVRLGILVAGLLQ